MLATAAPARAATAAQMTMQATTDEPVEGSQVGFLARLFCEDDSDPEGYVDFSVEDEDGEVVAEKTMDLGETYPPYSWALQPNEAQWTGEETGNLAPGNYTAYARFVATGNTEDCGDTEQNLSFTVVEAGPSEYWPEVGLDVSPVSSTEGTPVTLTATVSCGPEVNGENGEATEPEEPADAGTVTFYLEPPGGALGTPVSIGAGGTASTTVNNLPAGKYSVWAEYSGATLADGSICHDGSSSAQALVVSRVRPGVNIHVHVRVVVKNRIGVYVMHAYPPSRMMPSAPSRAVPVTG